MFLLFEIALLLLPLDAARFFNSFNAHVSDNLKLKCDALPYRTAYVGTKCYFAVTQEIKLDDATTKCNSIFRGAKVATNAPSGIFTTMMLDKSKFHVIKDSSGKSSDTKQAICFYDSNYKCEDGEPSTIIPGKCIEFHDKKLNYPETVKHCTRRGMEVPAVNNDLENRMIRFERSRSQLKEPVWIRNVYQGEINRKWNRTTSFSRFSTCDRPSPRLYAGSQIAGAFCPNGWGVTSVLDNTGYWGTIVQGDWHEVMCIKNAVNDFNRGKKICTPYHEFDDESGLCEWTGPKDACLQTVDIHNRTGFVRLPYFPLQTWKEVSYHDGVFANDLVHKVIVRRGCIYTGYQGWFERHRELMPGNDNVGYGEYSVPYSNTLDGLSNIRCMCDPTQATLNGHVPPPAPPPPRAKCIEHHEFNEATQLCEWKRDSKYCGELITFDGRRQMIEIPNWPTNKKYDVDHWAAKKAENFHIQVTQIIVRQHCWATLMTAGVILSLEQRDRHLQLSGYGKHQVKSHYNGQLENPNDGAHRIICQCIDTNSDVGNEKKSCIANHEYDEETGMCEWTGPKDACLQTIDADNRKGFAPLPYFPLQTWDEITWKEGFYANDMVTKVIVRRGCVYTGFPGYWDRRDLEVAAGNEHVGYGEYAVAGARTWAGLSSLWCMCDPSQATLNEHAPPPRVAKPKPKCIEHHEFNEATQACEWIHDSKYCAELITFDGRKQKIEIPNWPKNKKYDIDHWTEKKAENFHITVTQVIVRQHCWVTMMTGGVVETFDRKNRHLQTSGYGKHEVKSHYNGYLENPNDGFHRILCECIH